ncbi:uncharacterized protein LKV04_008902 [Tautogolabrus adspersus]
MDHQSSPAEVKVKCFYTVQIGNGNVPSPHSRTVSISIHNLPQPDLAVNPAVITETDTVTLNCLTPSSVSQCGYFTLSGGTARPLSCLQTLTGSELLKMDHQSSPAEVKVKCFYFVQTGDRNARSPDSEYSSVTVQSDTNPNKESVSTLTTSVSIKTSPADQGWTVGTSINGGSTVTPQTPGTPESEKIMWVIGAAVMGGVLLLGLALLFTQSRIDDQKYMEILTTGGNMSEATHSRELFSSSRPLDAAGYTLTTGFTTCSSVKEKQWWPVNIGRYDAANPLQNDL